MKQPKIGLYGDKDRKMQSLLSYEHVSLTWKIAALWRYLGPADSEDIDDVGNVIFMETPDRAYENAPILVNVDYEQKEESVSSLNQFNIVNPFENQITVRMHMESTKDIGRNPVEGDVIQIYLYPDAKEYEDWLNEQQQTQKPDAFLRENDQEAWLEVTDVDYSQEIEHFYIVLTTKRLEDARSSYEIPNSDSSNENMLENIQDKLGDEQSDDVSKDGLNTDDVSDDIENPNEDDDSGVREDYDSWPDSRKGFFDQI